MSTNPNEHLEYGLDEEEIEMPVGEQIPDDILSDSAPILGDTPEDMSDEEYPAAKELSSTGKPDESDIEAGEGSAAPAQKVTGAAMEAAIEFTKSRNASRRKAPRMQDAAAPKGTPERIRSNANEALPTFIAANSAKNSHRVISGQTITSVINNDKMDEPAAVCKFNNIPVYIPYSEFFANATPDISRGEKQRFLTPCIGATIDYVITDIQQISTPADRGRFMYIAYASRLPAMRFQQNRYFGPNATRKVEIGTDLDGTVLCVHRTKRSMAISVCGLDKTIVLSDITSGFTENIEEDLGYAPGKPIRVRVTSLSRDADGNLKSIKFSAREIEDEIAREEARDKIRTMEFSDYSNHEGIVRAVTKDARGTHYYVALVEHPGITVTVNGQHIQKDAIESIPVRGSRVIVSLRNVNIERPDKLTGVIVRKMSDIRRDRKIK